MAFHVMNADHRLAEREAERARYARADQERAGEPGPAGVGDAVEIGELRARIGQDALRERHDAPDVVARGELGHDAAVDRVHRHLRMERVGEQAAVRVVHGEAGLVAGGFDADDEHGGVGDCGGQWHLTIHGRSAVADPFRCTPLGCVDRAVRVKLIDCRNCLSGNG